MTKLQQWKELLVLSQGIRHSLIHTENHQAQFGTCSYAYLKLNLCECSRRRSQLNEFPPAAWLPATCRVTTCRRAALTTVAPTAAVHNVQCRVQFTMCGAALCARCWTVICSSVRRRPARGKDQWWETRRDSSETGVIVTERETRTRHDTVSLNASSFHWPIADCRQSVSYNFSPSLALHLGKLGTLSRCEKSNHRNEGLEGNVKVLSLKTLHIIFINSSALKKNIHRFLVDKL